MVGHVLTSSGGGRDGVCRVMEARGPAGGEFQHRQQRTGFLLFLDQLPSAFTSGVLSGGKVCRFGGNEVSPRRGVGGWGKS